MLELAIIVLLLLFGIAVGGAWGMVVGTPILALLLASLGGVAGTVMAYAILLFAKRTAVDANRSGVRPQAVAAAPIGTQVTFRQRMARYLKLEEGEVLQADSYKSPMPFWMLVDVYWRKSTRTAQEIRAILQRIRDRVRSSK